MYKKHSRKKIEGEANEEKHDENLNNEDESKQRQQQHHQQQQPQTQHTTLSAIGCRILRTLFLFHPNFSTPVVRRYLDHASSPQTRLSPTPLSSPISPSKKQQK